MTYNYRNPDAVKYTGFSGWLSTQTGDVIFCSRMNHLDMIEKSQLDGIDGSLVYEVGDGGPEGTGWMEIRRWCATLGWVHFVTDDEVSKLFFVASSMCQEQECLLFAREVGLPAVFKGTGAYR